MRKAEIITFINFESMIKAINHANSTKMNFQV